MTTNADNQQRLGCRSQRCSITVPQVRDPALHFFGYWSHTAALDSPIETPAQSRSADLECAPQSEMITEARRRRHQGSPMIDFTFERTPNYTR